MQQPSLLLQEGSGIRCLDMHSSRLSESHWQETHLHKGSQIQYCCYDMMMEILIAQLTSIWKHSICWQCPILLATQLIQFLHIWFMHIHTKQLKENGQSHDKQHSRKTGAIFFQQEITLYLLV